MVQEVRSDVHAGMLWTSGKEMAEWRAGSPGSGLSESWIQIPALPTHSVHVIFLQTFPFPQGCWGTKWGIGVKGDLCGLLIIIM